MLSSQESETRCNQILRFLPLVFVVVFLVIIPFRGNITNKLQLAATQQYHVLPSKADISALFPKRRNRTNADSNKPWIMCRQYGRTGNALYQYANLLATAWKTGKRPIIGPQFKQLTSVFNLSVRLTRNITFLQSAAHEVFERRYNVDLAKEILANLSSVSGGVILNGYFQSYKFFEEYSSEIRKEFTFKKEIQNEADKFLRTEVSNDTSVTRIGVHIRLGDLNTTHWIKVGFGTPPMKYFENSINFFRKKFKNVIFIVCSDYIKKVMPLLKGKDIIYSHAKKGSMDLAILSSCDHVIVGNGTFSWWAGWLCRGITIRYMQYPKPGTRLGKLTPAELYWPPNSTYNHYIAIDA